MTFKGINFTRCSNEDCPQRLACERAYPLEKASATVWQHFEGGEHCGDFIVRRALGGGDSDLPPKGRRGRRHNAHAPERKSYPGSEALFGKIFGPNPNKKLPAAGQRGTVEGRLLGASETGEELGKVKSQPQAPDLMVTRHLRNGKDIKRGDD